MIKLQRITSALIRHRRPIGYWICLEIIVLYIPLCAMAFWLWVNPSLSGTNSQHIAADSGTYIYMADVLREHRDDPLVYAALAHFPNTLWMPVAIAYALNSTVLTVFLNAGLLWLSLVLIQRSFILDRPYLLLLLLMNPTTLISLLSVNKEIVDLVTIACFCCYLTTRRRSYFVVACAIALLNRYEVLLCFVLFIALESRFNPWRHKRWLSLLLALCGLTVLLPLAASNALAQHFEEAAGGGLVTILDQMEMHFLFIFAAVPKIAENLFGEFLNPATISKYTLEDLANSYILLFNNLATLLLIIMLRMKGRFSIRSIRSDVMYLAAVASLIMSVSLVVQPRYFYIVYVLLSIEVARKRQPGHSIESVPPAQVLTEA